jgi:two-component system, chemotaxis family, response regulator Rcp1
MTESTSKLAEILLVEDNPADVRFTLEVLQESLINHVHVARDGQEALDFLHRSGKFGKAPKPDLILLDLNLPKVDGRQVLADVRATEGLKKVPVAIMTSSREHEDIVKAETMQASCYITKPIDPEEFLKALMGSGGKFRVVDSNPVEDPVGS